MEKNQSVKVLALIVLLLSSQLNAESTNKIIIGLTKQENPPIYKAKCFDINNWRALKRGMNKNQVNRLLGKQYEVTATSTVETWTYDVGSVDFSTAGLVNGWHEPSRKDVEFIKELNRVRDAWSR